MFIYAIVCIWFVCRAARFLFYWLVPWLKVLCLITLFFKCSFYPITTTNGKSNWSFLFSNAGGMSCLQRLSSSLGWYLVVVDKSRTRSSGQVFRERLLSLGCVLITHLTLICSFCLFVLMLTKACLFLTIRSQKKHCFGLFLFIEKVEYFLVKIETIAFFNKSIITLLFLRSETPSLKKSSQLFSFSRLDSIRPKM